MGKCQCGRLKGNPCGPLRPNTINVTMPSQESAKEYEQEIARREELARFVEAEREAQLAFDAQQAGIAARVDSMREGLLFRVPALYGGTGQ